MGKAGRFACIFTPMALTIASLVCLIIAGLGGTNQSNSFYNTLYFFRANTSDINVDPSLLSLPSNALTDQIINQTTSVAKTALNISDFYHVSLWNYCSGSFGSNSTGGTSDNVNFCSPHETYFWFNPVDVWNLNNTATDQFFSSELKAGLNTYRITAKWMAICYIVAVISTIVEILVGFTALFSRLGSLATTIISSVSSLFTIAFALTATILYATLTGTFNTALQKYNIQGSLGHAIYVTVWLAVAFSFGSGFFWLISSCCCSGRSDKIKGYNDNEGGYGRRKFQDAPHQYQRVESPLMGGQGYGQQQQAGVYHPGNQHRMSNLAPKRGTAYEPCRHEGA